MGCTPTHQSNLRHLVIYEVIVYQMCFSYFLFLTSIRCRQGQHIHTNMCNSVLNHFHLCLDYICLCNTVLGWILGHK